jgi:hypothetical protein
MVNSYESLETLYPILGDIMNQIIFYAYEPIYGAETGDVRILECTLSQVQIDCILETLLLVSASNGHLETTRYLVEHNEVSRCMLYSASNAAAKRGHFNIVEFLLDNEIWYTKLHAYYALKHGRWDVFSHYESFEYERYGPLEFYGHAILWAAKGGHHNYVKKLLERYYEVCEYNNSNETYDSTDAMFYLVKHGCNYKDIEYIVRNTHMNLELVVMWAYIFNPPLVKNLLENLLKNMDQLDINGKKRMKQIKMKILRQIQ